jgi:hypothetical protein
VSLIAAAGATPVDAQTVSPDPPGDVSMRLGPVAVSPTFRLTNFGVDTNILFEETNPIRDFTFTATPGARTWVSLATARLAASTTADWVFFARTPHQRTVNFGQSLFIDVPGAIVTPRVTADYLNTRQRPNAEIDARVRRRSAGWTAGVRLAVSPISTVDVEVGRRALTFDRVRLNGVQIDDALNRDDTHVAAAWRTEITPLTALVISGRRDASAFRSATLRDAASWTIESGLEFEPVALISGRGLLGYQRFTPVDPAVPAFNGLVANVDVQYLFAESTRVGARLDRHVEFSYWPNESYYVSTVVDALARQAVAADWDVAGRVGREWLTYPRPPAADGTPVPDRRDRQITLSVGVGYWLAFEGRIGVDVIYVSRQSAVAGRSYDGIRVGGSFSYGVF